MTLIIGVDPSSKKIALVAKETVLNIQHANAYTLYKGKETQSPETIYRAMIAMREYLSKIAPLFGDGPRYAFVEKPVIGRGGVVTTMKQAYVGGVIRACLVEAGFVVRDVNQSTWKSYLGANTRVTKGKGRQTEHQKANVLRAVKIRWPKIEGLITGDGDLTDAAGICLFGESQIVAASVSGNDARSSGGAVQRAGRGAVVRRARL